MRRLAETSEENRQLYSNTATLQATIDSVKSQVCLPLVAIASTNVLV